MALSCSVLITCYNYGRFVAAAIESALAQTVEPLEIIVVDDGSTDDTREVLEGYRGNPLVRVIHQRNQGHGAAMIAALGLAEGDLVFMLDADDKYAPNHLEVVSRAYVENKDVDCIFTAYRQFGDKDSVVLEFPQDKRLGFSVVGAMNLLYVGAIMPCLSMRRNLVRTLLPVLQKLAPRWRWAADDLLNYGSSLAGAQKLFLAQPTVFYRIHDNNLSAHVARTKIHAHWLLRSNAVAVFCDHFGIRPEIANRIDSEFASIERPTRAQYESYRSIVRGLQLPLLKRLKLLWRIRRSFRA